MMAHTQLFFSRPRVPCFLSLIAPFRPRTDICRVFQRPISSTRASRQVITCDALPCSDRLAVMPKLDRHERFMRAALAQAKKGLGFTSPNPAVGAVLVRPNRIIARGFH